MSACEQELCPFWSGSGCDCSVFDISEDERRREQRTLGIRIPQDDDREDEELPSDAIGRCAICGSAILRGQAAVSSLGGDDPWQHSACGSEDAA